MPDLLAIGLYRVDFELALFLLVLAENVNFGLAVARGISPARPHYTAARIVEAAAFRGHDLRKYGVHEIKHSVSRAEVARQSQRASAAPFEAVVLFREEKRLTAAEAVDGLLDVADEEHVLPASAGYNFLLHGVDVLIFVDEHAGILRIDFAEHLFIL